MTERNIEVVRAYLLAIEKGDASAFESLVDASATFRQWPNAIYPKGATVDVAQARADFERGKALLSSQAYRMLTAMSQGDRVAVEVEWRGVLAIDMKHLAAGSEMAAHCAMFIELADGRITSQRNYDCYEPL